MMLIIQATTGYDVKNYSDVFACLSGVNQTTIFTNGERKCNRPIYVRLENESLLLEAPMGAGNAKIIDLVGIERPVAIRTRALSSCVAIGIFSYNDSGNVCKMGLVHSNGEHLSPVLGKARGESFHSFLSNFFENRHEDNRIKVVVYFNQMHIASNYSRDSDDNDLGCIWRQIKMYYPALSYDDFIVCHNSVQDDASSTFMMLSNGCYGSELSENVPLYQRLALIEPLSNTKHNGFFSSAAIVNPLLNRGERAEPSRRFSC